MESKHAQIVYRTFRENAIDKKPLRHPKTPEGKRRRYPAVLDLSTTTRPYYTAHRAIMQDLFIHFFLSV